jgi:tRNA 2-thiouridine synthesizing protein A
MAHLPAWGAAHTATPANQVDVELDVRGYNCPIPLLRAKKALAGMQHGQVLQVLTTDPGAEIDFKVLAEATGHALIGLDQAGNVLSILIEKKQP